MPEIVSHALSEARRPLLTLMAMRTPTYQHQQRQALPATAGSQKLHATDSMHMHCNDLAVSPHQHQVLVGRAAAAGCEAQHPLAVRARLAHLCSIAARQQRQVGCAACMFRHC